MARGTAYGEGGVCAWPPYEGAEDSPGGNGEVDEAPFGSAEGGERPGFMVVGEIALVSGDTGRKDGVGDVTTWTGDLEEPPGLGDTMTEYELFCFLPGA